MPHPARNPIYNHSPTEPALLLKSNIVLFFRIGKIFIYNSCRIQLTGQPEDMQEYSHGNDNPDR